MCGFSSGWNMDISSSRDSPPSLSTSACPNRLLSRLRCSAVNAVKKKPTKQTNVATNQVVEGCGNISDYIKFRVGPVKREDVVAKIRPTLYFLQQLFANCNNLFCCKVGLIRGW